MKLWHYIVILSFIIIGGYTTYVIWLEEHQGVPLSRVECFQRQDDPEGYIFKICNYIKSNYKWFSINPMNYNIRDTSKEGNSIVVYLDCCYMGDVAYFNNETGGLVRLEFGDK